MQEACVTLSQLTLSLIYKYTTYGLHKILKMSYIVMLLSAAALVVFGCQQGGALLQYERASDEAVTYCTAKCNDIKLAEDWRNYTNAQQCLDKCGVSDCMPTCTSEHPVVVTYFIYYDEFRPCVEKCVKKKPKNPQD